MVQWRQGHGRSNERTLGHLTKVLVGVEWVADSSLKVPGHSRGPAPRAAIPCDGTAAAAAAADLQPHNTAHSRSQLWGNMASPSE